MSLFGKPATATAAPAAAPAISASGFSLSSLSGATSGFNFGGLGELCRGELRAF